MSKVAKLSLRASLGVALLAASVSAASAFNTDRAAWLNYLQEQRKAQMTARGTAPAVTGPGASGAVQTERVQTERVLPRGVLPARAIPQNAIVQPAPQGAAVATRTAAQTRPITRQIDPQFLPAEVPYSGKYKAGTIVIDTEDKYLYLVGSNGMAQRYGVGVGRPGFQWAGSHRISMKREWPGWTPPPQMRKRQPELPAYMEGGPENPLGARALYLGSTLYRIHGSNAPWTIGHEVSSGCIRMRNEDVIKLYDQVGVGTQVVVLR
ncbi:L,D-transpeptidase [Acuticoccus sp. M5D2P5]|uniref:L,D-transpeptidase n=1 Tax=Acuticoccus kalidii TaxID=2910977 RepID=UPI001F383BA4|nr:L,D-transpeptidase [Acuticoccus kalidii]MCF3932200.1 L,D-transpeptidase [Acuticoccus kalidii]